MGVSVKIADSRFDYARCVQIRTLVFTVGQKVPAEREIDADEDGARHFLAEIDGVAIGAGRWRRYGDDGAKIERIAVLDQARGKGIGRAIMQAIVEDIRADGVIASATLGAQDHAIPFYESLGFKIIGDGYLDGETIPHHDMAIDFRGAA